MQIPVVQSVIGFDLGHGETSLAMIPNISPREDIPIILRLNNVASVVTAVGYDDNGNILFGDAAIDGSDVISFDISFKSRPNSKGFSEKPIIDFVEAIVTHISHETHQIIDLSKFKFFIGCPSGWTAQEQNEYKSLLEKSRIPKLEVVKESRAAFMHAIESNLLSFEDLEGSILVIDIGSSTTDITYVVNHDDRPFDFGLDLGSSLIDEDLLELSIETATMAPSAELRTAMAENISFRYKCLLACRDAKEKYFNSYPRVESGRYTPNPVIRKHLKPDKTWLIFEVSVTREIMESILSKSNPKLEGFSWYDAFKNALINSKHLATKQGLIPSRVILTGGGSKMGFVANRVQEVFETASIVVDSEPHLTVSRGLARWGRIDLRMEYFVQEIRNTLEDKQRGVSAIVTSSLESLYTDLATEISKQLVDDILTPNMKLWRNNRIETLEGVELRSEKEIRALLEGKKLQEKLGELIADWINELSRTDLDNLIAEVCKKYNLHTQDFRIHLSKNVDIIASPDVAAPDELVELVQWAAGAVTGTILGLLATVLFASGVFGIIIAFIAYWLGREVVKEEVQKFVRETYIARIFRELISDSRISEIGEKQKLALQSDIIGKLGADEQYKAETIRKISNTILNEMMEKAKSRKLMLLI